MKNGRLLGVVCVAVAAVLVLSATPAFAVLTLEKSQEWQASGDTVAYSMYAKDVDADSTVEILTAGSAYGGPLVGTQAQLRIWNWNGLTLTLEKSQEFTLSGFSTESARSVYAADVDGDGAVEILTAGYGVDSGGNNHDHLVIWQWSGTTLTKELDLAQAANSTMRGVSAYNIDGTGPMEIVTVGELLVSGHQDGVVRVFNWNGTGMTQKDYKTWGASGETIVARGVYIWPVSSTSYEIVTAGYRDTGTAKYGQVRVYSYSGGSLSLLTGGNLEYQYSSSATEFFSVFAGVLYSGGDNDVVACGSYTDGSGGLHGLVEVSYWHTGALTDRNAYAWQNGTATQCHSVYAKDVAGNSDKEIFAAGYATISGTDNGQIFVFNYDGTNFSNKDWNNWYTTSDTQAHGVYVENVDSDSDIETLSAGQAKDAHGVLSAQLRIWHGT